MIKNYAMAALLLAVLFVAVKYLFKYFTETARMNKYLAFFLAFLLGSSLCGVLINFLPGRSKVAPVVSVLTTLHDREGLTEKDFDFDMLKNSEQLTVDSCMQQIRQSLASRSITSSQLNPVSVSESHFVTVNGKKLGIINLNVYPSNNDRTIISRAIRIMGFTSRGIETVNCIVSGDADIPLYFGECADKVQQVFGVSLHE